MKYGGKVKKMREGGMTKAEQERLKKKLEDEKMDKKTRDAAKNSATTRNTMGEGSPVKKAAGGMLKTPDNPGLKKLPTDVRNKMGYMKKGGKVHKMKKGGKVSSCSKRADGIAMKGKTKGKIY
jgi:hypothetical protein